MLNSSVKRFIKINVKFEYRDNAVIIFFNCYVFLINNNIIIIIYCWNKQAELKHYKPNIVIHIYIIYITANIYTSDTI